MNVTGMSEQWVSARIKQKCDSKCIPWRNLQDLILAHPDVKKRVDVFVLSIYGLVIFPKALGYIDEVVSDLFDRLDKRVTLVPAILDEAFRRDDIKEEKWMMILQNLRDEDVEWRAPWMVPNEILYRCGEFDWVPLLGIWGAVGYAPLLMLR
ncbi:6-phosphofructo-2-kinase/fructose-2,6-bisphosphatase-like protein [Gossypium australe]|uniref:6-phosphofructo-2-kinase/fructose-2, 6-bisphosphatase-like protein n=1 Tax=Gossypium australe TaxID=47621 RepID=A0A5B6WDI8_9ROSI|nr:6-phosphofructo-2-kinase/fructose-2,6-bisphosphatase-like protein [Gossypium australe]